jgi:hypothetical protein
MMLSNQRVLLGSALAIALSLGAGVALADPPRAPEPTESGADDELVPNPSELVVDDTSDARVTSGATAFEARPSVAPATERTCVTGEGLRRGERWTGTTFTWDGAEYDIQNRGGSLIGAYVGSATFQPVEITVSCITNTQAGVTSCGAQATITQGGEAPSVYINTLGSLVYNSSADRSELALVTAANNGVTTIDGSFATAAAVALGVTPTIGFSYAGANVGFRIDSAPWVAKRVYRIQESCQAM